MRSLQCWWNKKFNGVCNTCAFKLVTRTCIMHSEGPSWLWWYGSWIYNYLCNQTNIQTKVVNSNSAHGEMYSIQHYVIKFVSDWQQIGGFLVSSTNKTDCHNITEIYTITPNPCIIHLTGVLYLRDNCIVFQALLASIVDLIVANSFYWGHIRCR
jgi:hypothetical protein